MHQTNDEISDQQYEQLRKNLMEKSSNRMYATWTNPKKNKECKQIQAGTKCFCDHEYKNHEYQNPQDKTKIHCKVKNCPCRHYSYVPSQGNMDFKCNCKHSHKLHDPISRRCTFLNCGGCNRGFTTNFICALCNSAFAEHVLVFETRRQKQDQGKKVNDPSDDNTHDKFNLLNNKKQNKNQKGSNSQQQSPSKTINEDAFIKIQDNSIEEIQIYLPSYTNHRQYIQNVRIISIYIDDKIQLQIFNKPIRNTSNEPITDAEIVRRKAVLQQVHMYDTQGKYVKSGVKKETIRNEENSPKQEDQIRIKKDWNLKTMVIQENGIQIDVKKQLERQQMEEEFQKSVFQNQDEYIAFQKQQGKKGILIQLNQQLKEERKQLQQKYGHKPIDDQNEIKQLLQENYIKEDEDVIGGVSSYYLFYLPNKYGLEIKKRMLQQEILEKLVDEY